MATTTNADGTVTVTGGDCCCVDPCSCVLPAVICARTTGLVYNIPGTTNPFYDGVYELPLTSSGGRQSYYLLYQSPDFSVTAQAEVAVLCTNSGWQLGRFKFTSSNYSGFASFVSAEARDFDYLPYPACPPLDAIHPLDVTYTGFPFTPTGSETVRLTAGPCGVSAGPVSSVFPAPTARPCRHRPDDPEPRGAVAAAELSPERDWYRCGRPGFERLGLLVTECRTCGATDGRRCGPGGGCPGYEAAAAGGDE